jgi:hypothetical protein
LQVSPRRFFSAAASLGGSRVNSAQAVYDGVSTPVAHKTLLTLHNSGHNLLVDSEWQFVAGQTARFIYGHLG